MQAYRASFLGQALPGCSRPQRSACPSLPRRQQVAVRAQGDYASGSYDGEKPQVVSPVNNDPFVGFLESPFTSSPLIAGFLSNLPAYRIGVSPTLRGIEVGLAHGFFLPGPFIKLGPLRNVDAVAEKAGCVAGAGLIGILTICLLLYGSVSFGPASETPLARKTLSGRELPKDPLQSKKGWNQFAAGWFTGGISGVVFCYFLTLTLPYYQ